MAKNLSNPKKYPPPASSSDDEEQQESESSSEEDELPNPLENAAAKQNSDSEDPGSEIEAEPKSKPKRDSKEATALKRRSKVTSGEANAKKAKKDSGEEKEATAYFKRIWSEEDEIISLQGMIDLKGQDKKVVYEAVKESLSIQVSSNQFSEKIRKLKLKYFGKGNKSYSKPHDVKCLELCNCIWGSVESADKLVKPKVINVEEDKNGEDWFEKSNVPGAIASYGLDEHTVKQKWRMVPMEDKKKLEEKWKALKHKEIEFVKHRSELLHQVASLIAQAFS